MAVSKRLRYEILRRDNHACRYCGATAPDVKLTVDHVIPTALGGSDEPSNLVTACSGCNSGKTSAAPDQALVEDVAKDALKWAVAINRAAELRSIEIGCLEDEANAFLAWWDGWGHDDADGNRISVPRAHGAEMSVYRFLELGLSSLQLHHFTRVAMYAPRVRRDDRWSYFCGCCWGEIKKVQDTAKAAAIAEEVALTAQFCDYCDDSEPLNTTTEKAFRMCADCIYDRLKIAERAREVSRDSEDSLDQAGVLL